MMARPLQAHGLRSKVYAPILLAIFRQRFVEGATRIPFTLEDVRDALREMGKEARNAPDLIYRMKSRTALPEEIQATGFRILEITSRGAYAFAKGESTLIEYPEEADVVEIEDRTPLAVRRLLYEGANFGLIDEQGLLSVLRYNDLFSRFLGARAYHFKSHVRKSVPGVGQAEVDDVHVAVEQGETGTLTIVPVEAKAKDDPVNRVQIAMQVRYAQHAFPGHPVRPLTVKLFEHGMVLMMEFNVTVHANDLKVVRHR
ncbi:MAG: hypothetical protein ACREJ3_09045, partial [Polyangiaceae bacterium]